jgi:hypothetical protein
MDTATDVDGALHACIGETLFDITALCIIEVELNPLPSPSLVLTLVTASGMLLIEIRLNFSSSFSCPVLTTACHNRNTCMYEKRVEHITNVKCVHP